MAAFYIGSDVFYSFIVDNGLWDLKLSQKTADGYFSQARAFSEALLGGVFAPPLRMQFRQLLEYYGNEPIIVRSSSILEDGFGNSLFVSKTSRGLLIPSVLPSVRPDKVPTEALCLLNCCLCFLRLTATQMNMVRNRCGIGKCKHLGIILPDQYLVHHPSDYAREHIGESCEEIYRSRTSKARARRSFHECLSLHCSP